MLETKKCTNCNLYNEFITFKNTYEIHSQGLSSAGERHLTLAELFTTKQVS